MGRVEGKVIIVTGGATGIGLGISQILAGEGASVAIASRSGETGEAAARSIRGAGGKALFIPTDITQDADCRRLVDTTVGQFRRLDGLVNNAGIFPRANIDETTPEIWDEILGVNLKGAFFVTRYAVPHLRAAGGGCVVNIGSPNQYVGLPTLAAYSISKGGLVAMTRNLANALAPDRIRVNCVNPGWVITETEIKIQAAEGRDADSLAEAGRQLPLGRHQLPEDAAYAVLYLMSDEATQVSGDVINVDGPRTR